MAELSSDVVALSLTERRRQLTLRLERWLRHVKEQGRTGKVPAFGFSWKTHADSETYEFWIELESMTRAKVAKRFGILHGLTAFGDETSTGLVITAARLPRNERFEDVAGPGEEWLGYGPYAGVPEDSDEVVAWDAEDDMFRTAVDHLQTFVSKHFWLRFLVAWDIDLSQDPNKQVPAKEWVEEYSKEEFDWALPVSLRLLALDRPFANADYNEQDLVWIHPAWENRIRVVVELPSYLQRYFEIALRRLYGYERRDDDYTEDTEPTRLDEMKWMQWYDRTMHYKLPWRRLEKPTSEERRAFPFHFDQFLRPAWEEQAKRTLTYDEKGRNMRAVLVRKDAQFVDIQVAKEMAYEAWKDHVIAVYSTNPKPTEDLAYGGTLTRHTLKQLGKAKKYHIKEREEREAQARLVSPYVEPLRDAVEQAFWETVDRDAGGRGSQVGLLRRYRHLLLLKYRAMAPGVGSESAARLWKAEEERWTERRDQTLAREARVREALNRERKARRRARLLQRPPPSASTTAIVPRPTVPELLAPSERLFPMLPPPSRTPRQASYLHGGRGFCDDRRCRACAEFRAHRAMDDFPAPPGERQRCPHGGDPMDQ